MKGLKKRKVLPVWKVIILIFVGFIGIAGATALVLYFMGTFDEKVVPPDDLAFTQTIDGEGIYENGIYKLSSDSNLTIVSTTEDVTESKITLSLDNAIWTRNGYTSDGVIIVPIEVELGQAFTVELVKQNNTELNGDWIVGSVDGNSRLTARSENILLGSQTIEIAVDTPVATMELGIGDGTALRTETTQNVVVGAVFKITPQFLPSNSQYLFNDKSTSKRVFYQVLGSDGVNYVTYDESSDTFYANQVSDSRFAIVNAYAFSNSYYEKTYFAQNPEATTDEVIAFLQNEQNFNMAVTATINLKVLDIEVQDVVVEPSASTAEVYVDKYFTLSTNSTSAPNDMSLGVTIYDSGNRVASSLLGRVGIKIPKGQTNFSIVGGRVMKVTTEDSVVTIKEEDYQADFDYAGAEENVEYYILPYAGSSIDYNNYRWSLSASEVVPQFELSVNFFYTDEAGDWVTFFEASQEETIQVQVKESLTDSVSLTTSNFDMVINYNDEGEPIPAELSLSSDTTGNNVYTKVVYFLYNNGDDTNDVSDIFECADYVTYSEDYKGNQINISGISLQDNYNFYEISGTRLIAKKSYTGSIVVFAALVRTNADGDTLYRDGKYQLIAFSTARVINVDSTLSISKMTPTFSFIEGLDRNEEDGQYYLPAINRNDDGSVKDVVSFNLVLSSEDISKDVDKLSAAFGNTLKVVCCDRDGNEYPDQYLTLHSIQEDPDQRTANMAVFTGNFTIEEAFFSAGLTTVDFGRAISLKLVYDDGKEVRSKFVGLDEASEEGEIDYFYVYYQQPVSMTAVYQVQGLSAEDPIKVEISAGANGLQISWGDRTLTATDYQTTISNLNELLTFTITDIYGREIRSVDGVYGIQFVETREDSNYVLTLDETLTKIADFVSTNGTSVDTGLKVYVVDKRNDNERVMVADEETGVLGNVEMQSELFSFEITSEGIEYVRYDRSTEIGSTELADTDSKTEIQVSKSVNADDNIILSSLFEIYTTGSDTPDANYSIYFDGTWLQGFQGDRGRDLKKMLQFTREGSSDFEDSETALESISDYQGVAISTLKINAPFGEETTLVLRINSKNNLYSLTMRLTLFSDIEIDKSFEDYQTEYQDYLATSSESAVSIFAEETYDLDRYLSFTSDKYSWADALMPENVDVSSNVNGVFYEQQNIATLTKVTGADPEIDLVVGAVTRYTTITITLYYGVRSVYAFNTQIALFVNPNVVIVEKVDELGSIPNLDLNNIEGKDLSDYYQIYKATSYISGGTESSTLTLGGLTYKGVEYILTSDEDVDANKAYYIKVENGYELVESPNSDDLETYYEKRETSNGFVNIEGTTFKFAEGKQVDILSAYLQAFNIYSADGSQNGSQIDALKVQETESGEKLYITYSEKNRITIGFTVSYNAGGLEGLVSSIFPDATVVYYGGEYKLLVDAGGTSYDVAVGADGESVYTIESVTGESIYKNNAGTRFTTRTPTFIDAENSVNVYSTVRDGDGTELRINVSLDVIVSNVGREFVYYTNDEQEFNVYKDVEFDKLISSNFADLEENDVYETLVAGKSYKVLHDISQEYTITADTELEEGKVYYRNVAGNFEVVESPVVEDIAEYYEKNLPEAGFYYNSQIYNSVGRSVSVEIVTNGTAGYIENIAQYSNESGILTINSLEKIYTDAFIVLKFTISTTGSSVTSYSWYYRIKVEPNFTAGKVTYPYTDTASEEDGEFLDTNSEYYNSENLTYTIDPSERLNPTNSMHSIGYRFGDIVWTENGKPEGKITENFRLVSVSSDNVSVSFDGGKINISYKDSDAVGSAETVIVEKYWCVDNVEVIGSAMQYIFKLNQSKAYSTHLYLERVQNELEKNEDGSYDVDIVAGEGLTTLIPTVSVSDSSTEVATSFGAFIKGDMFELLDALKFKRLWAPAGANLHIEYVGGGEPSDELLTEDFVFVDDEWYYATVTGETVEIFNSLDEPQLTLNISDGIVTASMQYSGEDANVSLSIDDLLVDFIETGTLEYFETSDETPNTTKTYYAFADGVYTAVEFGETPAFEEGVTYYEKYRSPYTTITLNAKDTISKDSNFVIGIYTNEGVVFNINLHAQSYFEWTINKLSFDSGKTYTFGDVISSIISKNDDHPIEQIQFNLTNSDEVYREYYVQTSDTAPEETKTYYTLENGVYTEVAFAEGEEFVEGTTYYELDRTLNISDIIIVSGEIDDSADLSTITFEIAPLVSDVNLDFEVVVTADGADYTFNLTLEALACFDESLTRQVQDNSYRYGSVSFDVLIDNGDNLATIKPEVGDSTPVTLVKTENTTYEFVEGDGYDLSEGQVQITPDNVSETEEGLVKTLNVIGKFNGNQILSFVVRYRYSVRPNVTLVANYPNPDDNTNSEELANYQYEYISATRTNSEEGQRVSNDYVNFFGTSATFANGNRVVATKLAEITADIEMNWDISISSMSSNVAVYFSVGTDYSYSNYIDSETADRTIISDVIGGKAVNLRFVLLNTGSNADITFDIRVNEVLLQYKVTVINSPIVTVTTNSPNYNLNRETVYAEDLAGYEEQTLFGQNRLLNYTFRSSAVTGTDYYVRLESDGGNKIQTITVANQGLVTNVDLGQSYSGYTYAGTFSTLEGAQNNDPLRKVEDDSIFLSAPRITSRIVVTYYDGRAITLDAPNYIKLGSQRADSVKLTTADYHNEKQYSISVMVEGVKVSTNWTYNLYLEAEFGVSNTADSATSYSTITINAGEEKSLLDELGFDIYNTRTGHKYSNSGTANTDSLANSAGSVNIQLYGIDSNLKIASGGDTLQNVAYQIHQNLKNTTTSDGIKFSTGLIPRAGATLSGGIVGGSIDDNYVTHSAVVENGKQVDFSIRARGANNDGNHVMFRITYTVTFGDSTDPITISHNLLLKVLPNASVNFLLRDGSTSSSSAGTEIINGQTVASNQESPFALQDETSGKSFFLWKADSVSESAVQAYLYGNRTLNNANTFTYTYKPGTSGYNDYTVSLSSTGQWDESEGVYTSNVGSTGAQLEFGIASLSLGQKHFYVTAEDSYGFKLKFYFTLTATENPQIAEMTGTGLLVEGQQIVVGAQYLPVTPTIVSYGEGGSAEERQLLGTLVYTTEGNQPGEKYANTISNIPSEMLSKIYLSVQTSRFGVVTKEFTSFDGGEDGGKIQIWGGADDWNNWKTADGQPASIEQEGEDLPPINMTQEEDLNGQTISVYGVFSSNFATGKTTFENLIYEKAGGSAGKLEDVEIEQVYSTASGYESPVISNGGDDSLDDEAVLVSLRGISAYAFPASTATDSDVGTINAINTDAASEYTSRVNDIKVESIKFYYQGQEIGTASGGSRKTLITNSEYKFYTASRSLVNGVDYDDSANFTVPVIDGILFGTGNTLSNVEMRITLKEGGNSCTLSRYVSLQKAAQDPTFTTNIADNKEVSAPSGRTVYNDTLEVVLESGASVSFVVTEGSLSEVPQTGIITLTNSRAFTVTEYVGISANIEGLAHNFMSKEKEDAGEDNRFYITVLEQSDGAGVQFVYNGKTITTSSDLLYEQTSDVTVTEGKTYYIKSGSRFNRVSSPTDNAISSYYEQVDAKSSVANNISTYNNNITLHINDDSEVSSPSSSKSETLYFLYKGTGISTNETYQMVQTFSVFPEYKSATSDNIDTSGNIEFKVDAYYKATSSSDYYYIIPKTVWGAKLNLEQNVGTTKPFFSGANSYKFTYEISQDIVGGAGGAFIDENGTIVTEKNFNLEESTITVNVYMKISGQNGFFDEDTMKLKLCTFRMMLENVSSGTTVTTTNRYGIISDVGVVSVPTGYTLQRFGSTNGTSVARVTGTSSTTVACEVGDTLDFHEILDGNIDDLLDLKATQDAHNITYHIVNDRVNGVDGIVHYNNLNTYTITSAGTRTLTLIASYRTSNTSSSYSYKTITVTVMAYDVTSREDKVVMLNAETSYSLGSGNWYQFQDDGSIEELTTNTYTAPSTTGIYYESFVAKDASGQTTVYSYTFYVVANTTTEIEEVVLTESSNYTLSNLYEESGYRFYSVTGSFDSGSEIVASEISVETGFTTSANESSAKNYIVRSPSGEYFKLTVTYRFTSAASPTQKHIYVQNGASLASEVEEEVRADHSLSGGIVTVYDISDTNVLTKTTANATVSGSDYRISEKRFLVVYENDGKTTYYRYTFDFFVYTSSASVNIETTENSAYALTSANPFVIGELRKPDGSEFDENVSINYYVLSNGTLRPTTVINLADLTEDVEAQYFVRVFDGTNYYNYLVDLTFSLAI